VVVHVHVPEPLEKAYAAELEAYAVAPIVSVVK
jgi:hypothetical protein